MSRKKKAFLITVLFIYLAVVLWYTVLKRPTVLRSARLELFWSYRKWFAGDWELGGEILANMVMFVPLGFLVTAVGRKRKGSVLAVLFAAVLYSLVIEILQQVLIRGLLEWDDLVSNTTGAMLGWGFYLAVEKLLPDRRLPVAILSIAAAFAIVCIIVFVQGNGVIKRNGNLSPRVFCFQIDEAEMENGAVRLRGFAFRYQFEPANVLLLLRSTETGKKIKLTTESGIARSDVNDYFLCNYDYTDTGFVASGRFAEEEEYELMVKWPWTLAVATGVYLTGEDIHYAPEDVFISPDCVGTELESIVKNGLLRVYRPDSHCWVYQLDNSLYWIADQDFILEDDGTTKIQYQLWTTQIEKLPEKRLANKSTKDNLGGNFEEYELKGNFGAYRVMKRELPDAYSITAIVTGYYRDGSWVWKNCFRPIYVF